MPKEQSHQLKMLYKLNVNGFVIFNKESKSLFQNALNAYRVIESRKQSGNIMTIKGNKIKRTN